MSNTPKAFHSYFGGKNKMAKEWISHYTPKNVKTYCEPFSGSFAVYFFTQLNDGIKVVYNDFNKDQANLFHCSRDYKKMLEKIDFHLNNENGNLYCEHDDITQRKQFYKELYYKYKKSDFHKEEYDLGDYDRAAIYVFLLTSAFNSCSYLAAGFSGFNKDRMKLLTFINKLNDEYIQNKLDGITNVHSEDFEKVIREYDSPDTYFYIDPPYYTGNDESDSGERVGWYGASDIFDKHSHKRLCDLLKTLKGKWILSYYDFDLLSEWLPKDEYFWTSKEFFRSSASFSDNKDQKGEEILIMNYELTKEEIEENKKIYSKPVRKSTGTPKKRQSKTKPSQELVDKVLEQMKLDFEMEDLTSIEELLFFCPKKNLESYLPEVEVVVDDLSVEMRKKVDEKHKDVDWDEIKKKDIDDWSDDKMDAVFDEMNVNMLESEVGDEEVKEEDSGLYEASGLKEVFEGKEEKEETSDEDDSFWD